MIIQQELQILTEAFMNSGSSTAWLDAEVILSHVLQCGRHTLIVEGKRPLNQREIAQVMDARKRREAGEPIAYIVGKKEFYSLEFSVDSRVLVPRPETELLVDLVIRHAPEKGSVLDVGTGSGAIAVAVKHYRPDCRVFASDISLDALDLAQLNAARLLNSDAIAFRQGDLFAPWEDVRFDIIVSNPPYIGYEQRDMLPKELMFEPEISLFSGKNGKQVIFRLIDEAGQHLERGGKVLIEIGAGMSDDVANCALAGGYSFSLFKDYAGLPRAVLLQK